MFKRSAPAIRRAWRGNWHTYVTHLAQPARHPRMFLSYRWRHVRNTGNGEGMNLAALIGEVASEVGRSGVDRVSFELAVIGRPGSEREVFTVQVGGAQGEACRRFLGVGHRVAIEGRVVPGATPAEVIADRVQFLTTRAQVAAMAGS